MEGYIFGNYFKAPSTLISLLKIIGDMFFYFFLSWYFDHTLSSNRGYAEFFYIFFKSILLFSILKNEIKAKILY